MAFLRLEPQCGSVGTKRQFDGICETASDLSGEVSNGYAGFDGGHHVMAPGSIVFCVGDGTLYVKQADLSWGAV